MLSNYQPKIADFYNIPIGNVKKLVHSFIAKENVCAGLRELATLRLGLKLKKIHCVLEFNQSQWLKPYVEFNTHIKK